MTEVVAKLRYLRISPKKVRQVTALLKGLSFRAAEAQLRFLPQKSVRPLMKLLASAGANAVQNHKLRKEDLVITKILVDPGPILKRSMGRAHGRAFPINKRTSHVAIFLQPAVGKSKEQATPLPATSAPKEEQEKREKKVIHPKARKMRKLFTDKERVAKRTDTQKQRVFRRKAIG